MAGEWILSQMQKELVARDEVCKVPRSRCAVSLFRDRLRKGTWWSGAAL